MNDIKFKILKKDVLLENINTMFMLSDDLDNDYWIESHYLKDLPLKFDISLAAFINNKIVGFIIASKKDVIHIHRFVVGKEYRNMGIGALLQQEFENILKKLKINKITLNVSSDNVRAIKFYEKNNYVCYDHKIDTINKTKLNCMYKII